MGIKPAMKLVKNNNEEQKTKIVSDKDAEEAFKTILKWIGEDPDREELVETPKRLVKAFKEYFGGYDVDAKSILSKMPSLSESVAQILIGISSEFNSISHSRYPFNL